MDKSCYSSSDDSITTTTTTTGTSNNSRDQYLKHLNKISHKISKPPITQIRKPPTFDHHLRNQQSAPQQFQTQSESQNLQQQQQQQQQHQPPVYNINKNDFRDVVQKLTGSPAHERYSTPPPIHQPKPQSSRLQRIRPPPLAQISNRPPPLLNSAASSQPPPNPNRTTGGTAAGATFIPSQRQVQPLSPLPSFPAVYGAAESPISAYMRFLQSSVSTVDSDSKRFSGGVSPLAPLVSPRWNNLFQLPQHQLPPLPPQQQNVPPASNSTPLPHFQVPTSPLPFGCLPSPRSPYPLLSPSLLFSPTVQFGFQQLPLSPSTVPVSSPRWKGI